jgi:hypothetical protein
MNRAEQLKKEHADWLSEYRWDWIATLSLDFGFPSYRQALQAFHNWIDELERREGGRHFRWVRGISRDSEGRNCCLHVLIGGLHSRRRNYQQDWAERRGRALIERFDPSLRSIKHLVRAMDHDDDLEIDYELE